LTTPNGKISGKLAKNQSDGAGAASPARASGPDPSSGPAVGGGA